MKLFSEFYEALVSKYILNEQKLEENGFPLWADDEKKVVKMRTSELDIKKKLYVEEGGKPFKKSSNVLIHIDFSNYLDHLFSNIFLVPRSFCFLLLTLVCVRCVCF